MCLLHSQRHSVRPAHTECHWWQHPTSATEAATPSPVAKYLATASYVTRAPSKSSFSCSSSLYCLSCLSVSLNVPTPRQPFILSLSSFSLPHKSPVLTLLCVACLVSGIPCQGPPKGTHFTFFFNPHNEDIKYCPYGKGMTVGTLPPSN